MTPSPCLQLYQEIAEMCEEDSDSSNALVNFQRAADLYIAENSKSAADKCLNKIAMIASQDSNYDLAISTYEDIASHCLETNLLKFNAKGYLLNARTCARPELLTHTPRCRFCNPRNHTPLALLHAPDTQSCLLSCTQPCLLSCTQPCLLSCTQP